jgi:carbonic anhydrase
MTLSKLKLLTLSAIGLASGAVSLWDYAKWGVDWPDIDPELMPINKCGGKNQSPIDLKTTGWPEVNSKEDKF